MCVCDLEVGGDGAGEDEVSTLRPLRVPAPPGAQPALGQAHRQARPGVLARGEERSSLYIVARNPAGHLLQVLGGELHGGEVDVGDARAPPAQLPVTQAEDVGEGETGDK